MKGWFLELLLQRLPIQVSPFTVGRTKESDLTLSTGGVSRQHAEFLWDEGRKTWLLKDLGSTNGTFVNSKRLQKKPQPLKHNDTLYFGNVEVQLAYDPLSQGLQKPRDTLATENIQIKLHADQSTKSKIEQGIAHNIQQGLMSTQSLADTLNIDRSTLFRQIKQAFEQPPSDLIREKRLDYAKDMMKNSDNISQVAYSTGFESLAHFSRSFKKQFGQPPTDFLKEKHDSQPNWVNFQLLALYIAQNIKLQHTDKHLQHTGKYQGYIYWKIQSVEGRKLVQDEQNGRS